jgi:hypothetical protein
MLAMKAWVVGENTGEPTLGDPGHWIVEAILHACLNVGANVCAPFPDPLVDLSTLGGCAQAGSERSPWRDGRGSDRRCLVVVILRRRRPFRLLVLFRLICFRGVHVLGAT